MPDPVALQTYAEQQARLAEDLEAFSGLKLAHVKKQIAALLGFIGRDGIFDEYTKHDISHVNAMLEMLDWLVPQDTKDVMTPTDWLLAVLSIYFHDLGMLVTRAEYDARDRSGFREYVANELFGGDAGVDYRAKVETLAAEDRERFLYQEFVRHTHPQRVRDWVSGRASDRLGITHDALREVDEILRSLDRQFRRDLAMICESHHLSDLDDVAKYTKSQPYGNSRQETADLQYAAILLRVSDLLHMTRDRAPSIEFRVLSPTDPLSQREWARQLAVRSVRPQFGLNRDGEADPDAPRDTIEVHATFTEAQGFFGLTAYLTYARLELQKSHEWVQNVASKAVPHRLPWRHIDDTMVKTEGFLKETFQFTIDQARILDLLTGHTLYNDTSVVLRELVQNALDAVRLQHYLDRNQDPDAQIGSVHIHWNSVDRVLTVVDSGTGMTQGTIERHLLRVGASRYQDPDFRKRYPDFYPISRFGIGVLSTFMIADSVEIVTCHPDEPEARQLTLRSVHGRYLVRQLDKENNEDARRLAPHGTLIRLRLRASAVTPDVPGTARKWVVLPGCSVTVSVDEGEPVSVGYASVAAALTDALSVFGMEAVSGQLSDTSRQVRIVEDQRDGVSLAYALRWEDYFQQWSFVTWDRARLAPHREPGVNLPWVGSCVEGIRVALDPPAFRGNGIAAVANCTGPQAPRTNVARSALEATPELTRMLAAVYSMYARHVEKEMEELHEKRGFSLTWAAQESRYILSPLLSEHVAARPLLSGALNKLPLMIIEEEGRRRCATPDWLRDQPTFWTIDSQFFRHAEWILREYRTDASLSDLAAVLAGAQPELPREPVVCGFRPSHALDQSALDSKEVASIRIHPAERRVDLRWAVRSSPYRWAQLTEDDLVHIGRELSLLPPRREWSALTGVLVGRGPLDLSGCSNEIGVRVFGMTLLFPGTRVGDYLLALIERVRGGGTARENRVALSLFDVVMQMMHSPRSPRVEVDRFVRHVREQYGISESDADLPELCEVIGAIGPVFDTSVWRRDQEPKSN